MKSMVAALLLLLAACPADDDADMPDAAPAADAWCSPFREECGWCGLEGEDCCWREGHPYCIDESLCVNAERCWKPSR